jgi:hypothetical protein
MPFNSSRFVQLVGLVRFLVGKISTSKGSSISHSLSVKLLEYDMVTELDFEDDFTSSQ